MGQIVIWALLTGGITGAVWVGIVLLKRQRRIARLDPEQLDRMQQRVDELEDVGQRLVEAEERLDFAERLLQQQRVTERPHSIGD